MKTAPLFYLKILGASTLFAFGLICLVSCDGSNSGTFSLKSKPEKRLRFAISVDALSNPMRNYQVTLLERLIRTRPGIDLVLFDANGDTTVQEEQLKKMIADGVDYLLVFPQNREACIPSMRTAKTGGTIVVAFAEKMPPDACTTSIYTEERRLGNVAGQHILTALKKKAEDEGRADVKGRLVQLTGSEDSPSARERSMGFLEAFKETPGVIIVHEATANGIEKEASERTKEALKLQKTFDVIYAQNDSMARGASTAILEGGTAARETLLIIGTDGAIGKGGGIEMLMHGDIEATVYQPPLVDKAWELVKRTLDEPEFKIEKSYQMKPFVLTAESAEDIMRKGLPAPELERF